MPSFWEEAEEKAQAKSTPNDEFDVDLDSLEEDRVEDDEEEIEKDTDTDEEDIEKEADTDVEEKPTDKDKVDDTGLTAEQQKAVKEDVIKRVGPDTILKVKGVEKKASELSPREMVVFLQKGMNADRLYQETAAEKRELARQRAMVEQGAAAIQEYAQQHKTGLAGGGLPRQAKDLGLITEIPEYLKPSVDDTPEVHAWKESQVKVLDELNQMKLYIANQQRTETDNAKVNDVLRFRDDYPMASIDECLAVKSVRPDVDTEELMRASHNYYSGGEFIKKAMDANPTYKREYDAAVIKNYLAGKNTAPKIKGRKVHGSNIDKVSFGKDKKNFGRTFEEAETLSHQFFDELDKIERES
jgi:hypothetical protein